MLSERAEPTAVSGVSGWRGGEREEVGVWMGQGGGRAVQAYVVTSETGRMLAGGYTSHCSGI